jgi:hypothetical protein
MQGSGRETMTPEDGVTLKEYFNSRCNGLEVGIRTVEEHLGERIDALSDYVCEHFQFEEENRKEREEEAKNTLTLIDTRIKELELAKSFSAGKTWMIMAILATIPTVLALIALFS